MPLHKTPQKHALLTEHYTALQSKRHSLVTECLRGVVVGEAEALEEEAPWDRKEFMLSTEASRPPGIRSSTSEEPTIMRKGNENMGHGILFPNSELMTKVKERLH